MYLGGVGGARGGVYAVGLVRQNEPEGVYVGGRGVEGHGEGCVWWKSLTRMHRGGL